MNLPKDVLNHIFSYCPIFSLVKFRPVCQQWNRIINQLLIQGQKIDFRIENEQDLIIKDHDDHLIPLNMISREYCEEVLKLLPIGGMRPRYTISSGFNNPICITLTKKNLEISYATWSNEIRTWGKYKLNNFCPKDLIRLLVTLKK
jgi:hypothetical protein